MKKKTVLKKSLKLASWYAIKSLPQILYKKLKTKKPKYVQYLGLTMILQKSDLLWLNIFCRNKILSSVTVKKTHFWDVVHTKWSHRGAFPDGTQTAPGTRGHTTLLSFLTLFKRKTKTEKHPQSPTLEQSFVCCKNITQPGYLKKPTA